MWLPSMISLISRNKIKHVVMFSPLYQLCQCEVIQWVQPFSISIDEFLLSFIYNAIFYI